MTIQDTEPAEAYWDSHDVAEYLKVHVSWVKNHCTRVKPFLPHYVLGSGRVSKRRFKKSEVEQFMQENVAQPRMKPNCCITR